MARRPVGRTLVRAPKRRMFWLGATGTTSVTTAVPTTQVVVSEASLEQIPNPTLVRVRGEMIIHPSVIGAAGATAVIGAGLIIVTAKALAGGVAALPIPITDIGSDWLYHRMSLIDVQSAITVEDGITQNVRFEVDNKAMRKFDLNQVLAINVEAQGLASTMTVELTWALRLLFKS